MAKKSKTKGGRYEGDVCKQLSLWFSGNKRDDLFYKTAGSGARQTVRQQCDMRTAFSAGDVGLCDPAGKVLLEYFLIEIKRGYNEQLIASGLPLVDKHIPGEPLLVQWFKKAELERKHNHRNEVIIIFRRDYCSSVIAMREELFDKLITGIGEYKRSNIVILDMYATYGLSLALLPLDHFFKWAKPKYIKQMHAPWAKCVAKMGKQIT